MPIKHMVLPRLAARLWTARDREPVIQDSLPGLWAMFLGFLEKSPLAECLASLWSGLVFITSEPVLISTLSLGTKEYLSETPPRTVCVRLESFRDGPFHLFPQIRGTFFAFSPT